MNKNKERIFKTKNLLLEYLLAVKQKFQFFSFLLVQNCPFHTFSEFRGARLSLTQRQMNCRTKDSFVPKNGLLLWMIFHLNPGDIWYGSTLKCEVNSCEIVTGCLLSQSYKVATEVSKLLSKVALQPHWLCHTGQALGSLMDLEMRYSVLMAMNILQYQHK